jgi:hypothetical protein
MIESWLCAEYTGFMKHHWLLKCLLLSFLIFHLAPNFHHHDHPVTDSNCHLCMLGFHPLQLILQGSLQLPTPISKTLPLLPQEPDIFILMDGNILSNRSPPHKGQDQNLIPRRIRDDVMSSSILC